MYLPLQIERASMNFDVSTFAASPEEEIYRGYEIEDLALVASFAGPVAAPDPDFIIDFFGVKTRSSLFGGLWGGHVVEEPPIPSDSRLAEGIEYVSACIALEQSKGRTFTHVEVGAGWGPWTTTLATLALRRGFSTVNAVAVEASKSRFELLKINLVDNGLLPATGVTEATTGRLNTRIFNAAGWWKDTNLFFPSSDDAGDAGMAATGSRSRTDYRGIPSRPVKVPAMSIAKLCAPYDVVDFMHIDIQGGEWELIKKAKKTFDSKVRFLFVGTHSRKIEGDLIDLLLNKGWKLFREKPCRFHTMGETPALTGLTYHDGAQFWRNMHIA